MYVEYIWYLSPCISQSFKLVIKGWLSHDIRKSGMIHVNWAKGFTNLKDETDILFHQDGKLKLTTDQVINPVNHIVGTTEILKSEIKFSCIL